MEIQGKIIEVQPVVSGTSERTGREWSRQTAVLETQEQYPRQIAFDVNSRERIEHFSLHVGDEVRVDIDLSSRKYNDRWFTSVSAWGCTKLAVSPFCVGTQQANAPEVVQQSTLHVSAAQGAENDLPF